MPLTEVAPVSRPATWLHPVSGILVLALDWLFFGAEVITLETGVLVASLAAFASTAAGVYWIQRSRARDARTSALVKALFCGVIAGLPTSIGGTVLGTAVLALAGVTRWRSLREVRGGSRR